MEIRLNIAKKHLYILMAFVLAVVGIVLVIGYGTTTPAEFGHSAGELSPPDGCSSGQFLQWNGASWSCASGGSSGDSSSDLTWFGNAAIFLKDGATAEASCYLGPLPKGIGFADNVLAKAKKDNGKVYTQVAQADWMCDSGWVEGNSASCTNIYSNSNERVSATVDFVGIRVEGGPIYYAYEAYTCTESSNWK